MTTQNEATPSLPMFYKQPELLHAQNHRLAGLLPGGDCKFAKEAVAIPVVLNEFAACAQFYPIVFTDKQKASPIVVLGVKDGHNLFVQADNKWIPETYIPAYVRRYPFISSETGDNQQLLAVDTQAERFLTSATGENEKFRLFLDDGQPTEITKQAMNFCNAFHADIAHTMAFSEALMKHDLLTDGQITIQFEDKSEFKLDGFAVIDEKKFTELPAEVLKEWHTNGFLGLIYIHFFSSHQWQKLLRMNHLQQTA